MAEASLLIPVIKGTLELSISLTKDPIMDQIKPVWGFKKDLKKLCQRLEIIQSLLEAAENQNLTSKPMLATWLKHLKAATCDAENVLDELAYEDLRRKTEEGNHMGKKILGELKHLHSTNVMPSDLKPCILIYDANYDLKVGFNMRKLAKGNVTIKLWDLGGQWRFRGMWEWNCRGVSVILYVVDAADRDSVPISRSELHDLLTKPSLSGIPLLVLSNEIDKSEAISKQARMDQLGLESISEREVCCYLISRKDSVNIDAVVDWLIEHSKMVK
ncbi:hypothetical protein Vadar_028520 [Vaccinium darrowii]|uniref:Uncharacterized protein n=1 Tax=Vaccinium darrowii TaxID=229202 RepID=A0ACB7Z6V9_9ERIC|nr:hypothetical protein Vadar_028520 [Vaccinium darrowii]